MAHLHLSLNEDRTILLKPIGEITENEWLTVQLWWVSPTGKLQKQKEINITINDQINFIAQIANLKTTSVSFET